MTVFAVVGSMAATFFLSLGLLGSPPSADHLAAACATHGRVAQVTLPVFRPGNAIVVCRDGTVHSVKP